MARVIACEPPLHGVHGMAVRHYPELLGAVAAGIVDPTLLVGATVGLDGRRGRAGRDGRLHPHRRDRHHLVLTARLRALSRQVETGPMREALADVGDWRMHLLRKRHRKR